MKQSILIISSLMIASFSFSQSQGELNENANKSLEKADKELNEVYSKILKEYKADSVFIKNLKTSQRLWVQFRDAEINVKYPEKEEGYYGSVQPMCFAVYKEKLTLERIKTLKIWLNGIEEGDVCRGSVKIKE